MPNIRQVHTQELNTSNLPRETRIEQIFITIKTSNADSAGTDAVPRVVICERRFDMAKANHNDFERGVEDTYVFNTPGLTMEELRGSYIELSHNNAGDKPGWLPEILDIEVKPADNRNIILYKHWVNIGWLSSDTTLIVELQDGSRAGQRIVNAIDLQQNQIPDDRRIFGYSLRIRTSNRDGAGTDANVYFAALGFTELLDHRDDNDFERGSAENFYFDLSQRVVTMGQIRESLIALYHDNRGSNPGWYIDSIVMSVVVSPVRQLMLYKFWENIGWLATNEPPFRRTGVILQLNP